MSNERDKEYKPLSFSTTMRNPARIVDFLKCILPFEGQILTDEIIHKVTLSIIMNKLYKPNIVGKELKLKEIYNSENGFSVEEAEYIIENSPQNHKEAGFEKGWASRFDTWYKLAMEFGFIYYEMNKPIQISTTGHMLIDAMREIPYDYEKFQSVFLNALMKYQTNNPFRKNANTNVPLPLLLNVIKRLKDDKEENGAGIFRKELPLVICWKDNDSEALYKEIKSLRKKYKFKYSDEIIYEICLKILNADESKKKRFKMSQIITESVDEFIRKMRIAGVISLRGNGRFIDFNSFENKRIEYILAKYSSIKEYSSKVEYFEYLSQIDANILSIAHSEPVSTDEIKEKTIVEWAKNHSKEYIYNELNIACGRNESKDSVLKIIDKPTRFEFLVSIALKQQFENLIVKPNYKADDEGIPTFTAAGGVADIECFDLDCNPLVEVTLMNGRTQATNEIPAITRHLNEAIEKYQGIKVFTVFVAPTIHTDTVYMAKFSKWQYHVDILTFNISEFIDKIKSVTSILEMLPFIE